MLIRPKGAAVVSSNQNLFNHVSKPYNFLAQISIYEKRLATSIRKLVAKQLQVLQKSRNFKAEVYCTVLSYPIASKFSYKLDFHNPAFQLYKFWQKGAFKIAFKVQGSSTYAYFVVLEQ